LEGLILFGSALALRHDWRDLRQEPVPFSDHVKAWTDQPEPGSWADLVGPESPRWCKIEDDCAGLHDALCSLAGRDVDLSKAANLRFSDFVFLPEDLWPRPYLTWLVVPKRSKRAPYVDQETPISRHPDTLLCDALSLFQKWWKWHVAPSLRNRLADFAFGNRPEEYHFINYVAEVCEEPQPCNRPVGSGYQDAAHSAASYAWRLLYRAGEEGRALSISQAVRDSLSCFAISSRKPEAEGDLEETILAISPDQAEKRVRKLLEAIIRLEPPRRPLER
jgi:hypothetical protein